MASRNAQTMAKRARELAVKEKRERKKAKKAARAAGLEAPPDGSGGEGYAPLVAPEPTPEQA